LVSKGNGLRIAGAAFLKQLRRANLRFPKAFAALTSAGYDRRELVTAVCAAAYAHRFDAESKSGVDRKRLRSLLAQVRDVAAAIRQSNRSLLAGPREALGRRLSEPGQHLTRAALDEVRKLEALPNQLERYAVFLEQGPLASKGRDSSKSFRLSAAVWKFIIADVKRVTKKEHYAEITTLYDAVLEVLEIPNGRSGAGSTNIRTWLSRNLTPRIPGHQIPELARLFLSSELARAIPSRTRTKSDKKT
jgi:hypothetical protein